MKTSIHHEYKLNWVENANKIKPTAIVLHWWGVPTWFGGIKYALWRLKRRQLSVQYLILKNGEIYQLVDSPNVYCKHARCANKSSIGIELQGFGKRDLDRQQEQFKSLTSLVEQLSAMYRIKPEFRVDEEDMRFFGIISHKQVDLYCNRKRIIPKKDVHDKYVERVRAAVSET